MVRSPFIILMLLLSLLSCKQRLDTSTDTSKKPVSAKKIQAEKYSALGDSFSRVNKLDSAFYYYYKSTELFKEQGSSTYIAYNLIGMA